MVPQNPEKLEGAKKVHGLPPSLRELAEGLLTAWLEEMEGQAVEYVPVGCSWQL